MCFIQTYYKCGTALKHERLDANNKPWCFQTNRVCRETTWAIALYDEVCEDFKNCPNCRRLKFENPNFKQAHRAPPHWIAMHAKPIGTGGAGSAPKCRYPL